MNDDRRPPQSDFEFVEACGLPHHPKVHDRAVVTRRAIARWKNCDPANIRAADSLGIDPDSFDLVELVLEIEDDHPEPLTTAEAEMVGEELRRSSRAMTVAQFVRRVVRLR